MECINENDKFHKLINYLIITMIWIPIIEWRAGMLEATLHIRNYIPETIRIIKCWTIFYVTHQQ